MRHLIATAFALGAAAPAFAAGPVDPAPEPVVVAPAPVPVVVGTDWTGFYAGGQFDFIADGELSDGPDSADLSGQVYGVFGGYRYDFGDFVVGGEIDFMIGTGEIDSGTDTTDIDYDRIFRAGVEGGWDAGRALIYGTVGFASLEASAGGDSDSSNGYFFGAGIDYLVTDQITVGAELLQHRFEDFDGDFSGAEADVTTFGINAAFRF